ncbi:porin, partial [Klebsiella pneumoniae]|nr:porin [Klebsiella pneumoniae]
MKISTVATTLMAGAAWLPLAANAAGDGPGIQLYGVVDAGIATTHTSGQGTHNGVLNGGLTDSLWGLRGSEDLGDGW